MAVWTSGELCAKMSRCAKQRTNGVKRASGVMTQFVQLVCVCNLHSMAPASVGAKHQEHNPPDESFWRVFTSPEQSVFSNIEHDRPATTDLILVETAGIRVRAKENINGKPQHG